LNEFSSQCGLIATGTPEFTPMIMFDHALDGGQQ
jgi:hypothetical protein